MPLPTHREIAPPFATVTENDRAKLSGYLSEVRSDDELFARCVRKAVRALREFGSADQVWLEKWLPIIKRKLDDSGI